MQQCLESSKKGMISVPAVASVLYMVHESHMVYSDQCRDSTLKPDSASPYLQPRVVAYEAEQRKNK